jgi:serpin B
MKKSVFFLLLLISLIACKSEKKIKRNETPEALKLPKGEAIKEADLIEANNKFSFALFKELVADENLFVSAYSLCSAMAMVYAGAGSDTEKEIAATFYWPANSISFHEAMSAYSKKLEYNEKEFQINQANKLYADTSLILFKEFLDINQTKYKSEAEQIMLKNADESANGINKWVSEKTQKMIPQLLKAEDLKDVKSVLVNAVYFYGSWANPFNEEASLIDTFYLENKEKSSCSYMTERWNSGDADFDIKYYQDSLFQVLEIPYSKNLGSMIIILPCSDSLGKFADLNSVLKKLSFEQFTKLLESPKVSEVPLEIKIPKWKQRTAFNLSEQLEKMGMKSSFQEGVADFKRISDSDPKLHLGPILHQSAIEVSEKGTKASASTAVTTKGETASAPQDPIYFSANHPFIYLIRENKSGTILFMGQFLKAE